jgi:hypothetical protein
MKKELRKDADYADIIDLRRKMKKGEWAKGRARLWRARKKKKDKRRKHLTLYKSMSYCHIDRARLRRASGEISYDTFIRVVVKSFRREV